MSPRSVWFWVCLAAICAATSASAQSVTSRTDTQPYPGVTIAEIRTASPATDVWAAFIDLCQDHIHIDATAATTSRRTTGSFASSLGAQLGVNGDFYKTSPILRVYGDAVGGGVRWPLDQTGVDPGYSWEWFYQSYGWIAFGPDWVDFTHTAWVKEDSGIDLSEGWANDRVAPAPPPDTLALVSGFPELVTEGLVRTCADPTSTDCFPDRGDMTARHPRTAMGLTADRQTFILVVVDGRTGRSAGMRGAELAWLMGELGAWQAFNLDGGGSTEMWTEADGYINDVSGNAGGGVRAVTNHWGVFAGAASGLPIAPGHCMSGYEPPPCQLLGPSGGVLDEDGPCFDSFGALQYWRQVDDAGYDGSMLWTNAFRSATPSNWARWNLHLAAAGYYRVEVYVEPAYGLWTKTRYEVRAGGETRALEVDQSAGDGWLAIGEWDFAEGGRQWVSVFDHADGAVPSNQHIAVDAVRLVRLDCEPAELCNGIDDDCDGLVPDDELDGDDDGMSPCEGDCDDTDPGRQSDCGAGDEGSDDVGSVDAGSPDAGPDAGSPDVGVRPGDLGRDVVDVDTGAGDTDPDELDGVGLDPADPGASDAPEAEPSSQRPALEGSGCSQTGAPGSSPSPPWLWIGVLLVCCRRLAAFSPKPEARSPKPEASAAR